MKTEARMLNAVEKATDNAVREYISWLEANGRAEDAGTLRQLLESASDSLKGLSGNELETQSNLRSRRRRDLAEVLYLLCAKAGL